MMYDYLTKVLPENNYHRYEISNFALAGYESKHNLSYWQDQILFRNWCRCSWLL